MHAGSGSRNCSKALLSKTISPLTAANEDNRTSCDSSATDNSNGDGSTDSKRKRRFTCKENCYQVMSMQINFIKRENTAKLIGKY
jgi:hypothetical protein